ncbi:MAG: redoxin family protein [Gammaproteobacteria bacterium]|nr:redoxin family protein [Gammaproteobacteria bacterium]
MNTLNPGTPFPELGVTNLDGNLEDISKPSADAEWRAIVVYRGKHCPMCTKYLNKLEDYVQQLKDDGIEVVAVSADSRKQLLEHLQKLNVSYPFYHGLTMDQMQTLGLRISSPRSEAETDHQYAEPGLFVVNGNLDLHIVDISNNPFVRPDIETLANGLQWIKENNYPTRGTWIAC